MNYDAPQFVTDVLTRFLKYMIPQVLSNIARYSDATTLSCTIDKSETNIKMMFIDDGVPFDQSKVKVENRDFDELDSGGMGLRLIRQSVESMAYERSNGKNILTLSFSI